MSKDFDSRFQEMAARQQEASQERSGEWVQAILGVLSTLLGFLFITVLYSAGIKLISLGIDYPLDFWHTLLTGAGFTIIHLAVNALTWARK